MSHLAQVARLRHLATEALRQYDIAPDRMQLLVHAENTTFRVWQGPNQYNLRIHRPGYQSPEAIKSELQYLAALHAQTDVIAPDPIPTKDGQLLLRLGSPRLDEDRNIVLFRWIDGTFRRKLTPLHAYQIGEIMAKIQKFGREFKPPEGFTRRRLDLDGNLGQEMFASFQPGARLLTEDERQLVLNEAEEAREALRELGQSPDVYGLIHADLHQGNVLWQGKNIAAIDFDDLGYAHFHYDFAAALAYTLRLPNYQEVTDQVLSGFHSIAPLPPRIQELLPLFLRVRFLTLIAWFIQRSDSPAMTAQAPTMIARSLSRIKSLHQPWGTTDFK